MTGYSIYSRGPNKDRPKTLTDRVIRFLIEGQGREEFPSKNKYRKFTGLGLDSNSFYWVGKAGAVRAGKSGSNSRSLTSKVRKDMELWERENNLFF